MDCVYLSYLRQYIPTNIVKMAILSWAMFLDLFWRNQSGLVGELMNLFLAHIRPFLSFMHYIVKGREREIASQGTNITKLFQLIISSYQLNVDTGQLRRKSETYIQIIYPASVCLSSCKLIQWVPMYSKNWQLFPENWAKKVLQYGYSGRKRERESLFCPKAIIGWVDI